MKIKTEDDRGGIQSIARAASVLRALGRRQQGMSLGEIARVVGLPRSTVQRLVQALQQERLVEVGGLDGPGVRLGPGLAELAGTIRVDVVRVARPHLQVLFDTLHETVDIAEARGGEVQFLDQIVSDRELRAVSRKNGKLSLHWLACGKVLLAAMSACRGRVRSGSHAGARDRPQRHQPAGCFWLNWRMSGGLGSPMTGRNCRRVSAPSRPASRRRAGGTMRCPSSFRRSVSSRRCPRSGLPWWFARRGSRRTCGRRWGSGVGRRCGGAIPTVTGDRAASGGRDVRQVRHAAPPNPRPLVGNAAGLPWGRGPERRRRAARDTGTKPASQAGKQSGGGP